MSRPSVKFPAVIADLVSSVLHGPGETSVLLRQVVAARAGARSAPRQEPAALPAELAPFVDRLANEPGVIESGDIVALRVAGYDEDEIFELSVSVALGAALARLERGLAALQEVERCD
jgi:alkylhydroperoxidase family enzyme